MAFIFNKDVTKVLLINKTRPEWQRGKLNGLGGKIEENESPVDCVLREVKEESMLGINQDNLKYFGEMVNADKSSTQLFAAIYLGNENDAHSNEDQEVEWVEIKSLPTTIMTNLSWLIPMALDQVKNNNLKSVQIAY